MDASDIQEVLRDSTCLNCYGLSMADMLKVGYLDKVIAAINANGKILDNGIATLAAGVATVNSAQASAANTILLTYYSLDATVSTIWYDTITEGVSFVIHSMNGADTNRVSWVIIRP